MAKKAKKAPAKKITPAAAGGTLSESPAKHPPKPPAAPTVRHPAPPKPAAVVAAAAAAVAIAAGKAETRGIPPLRAVADVPDRAAALAKLALRVGKCTRCAELARTRTKTVFGVGNPHTKLVFLGEAPGADEDKQGEPFVGDAGQLLNKIITACTLKREDVYILNILRCRPPGNRAPAPEEAENCREYLEAQLEIIKPEFICCLGAVASQNLLHTTTTIGQLRGKFLDYRGAKVLCTYHPAYLLRNPAAKAQVWEDMKKLMAEMGVPLPSK